MSRSIFFISLFITLFKQSDLHVSEETEIADIKFRTKEEEYTLYNVRVLLDQFWPPIVQCYSTEDAVRIGNPFITIPITRNYNHSQLFLTLLRVYTIIILTRS
jgi:hypothetical protein